METGRWGVFPANGEPPSGVLDLARDVQADGGSVLRVYQEPVGQTWQLFALLPMTQVQPTPYQQDLSPTHAKRVYIEMDRPWVLINPEIIEVGTEDFVVWDDCFSFPNLMVRVNRAYRIRVRYQDGRGETHEVDLEGDRAELVQHEIDHLDGVLAVDRPHGLQPFSLREEWNRLYTSADRYGPPEPRVSVEHLHVGTEL